MALTLKKILHASKSFWRGFDDGLSASAAQAKGLEEERRRIEQIKIQARFWLTWKELLTFSAIPVVVLAIGVGLMTLDLYIAKPGSHSWAETAGTAVGTVGFVLFVSWFFYVWSFFRRRRAERRFIAKEQAFKRAAQVSRTTRDFFEAPCPSCRATIAIFSDDPDTTNCGCGAILTVNRSGEHGTLLLKSEAPGFHS